MNYQIDVSSTVANPPEGLPAAVPVTNDVPELLRQILEVQREQLAFTRAAAASHDMTSRWRQFLSRWGDEFPELAGGCKKSLPHLERCYARLISELNDRLDEEDGVDNEFALQEFLDRYGIRLAQLGTILNLVGPLAEAGQQNEASS